jgi:hypothetical protein
MAHLIVTAVRAQIQYKQEVLGRTNCLLSLIWHGPQWKRRVQQFLCGCVRIRYCGNLLPSRCLATIRGYTYRRTDWWKEFMKYIVDVGSGAVIHVPSFIKIGSGIQKLIRWYTDTQTATWSHKCTSFFQNKESRLKKNARRNMYHRTSNVPLWAINRVSKNTYSL